MRAVLRSLLLTLVAIASVHAQEVSTAKASIVFFRDSAYGLFRTYQISVNELKVAGLSPYTFSKIDLPAGAYKLTAERGYDKDGVTIRLQPGEKVFIYTEGMGLPPPNPKLVITSEKEALPRLTDLKPAPVESEFSKNIAALNAVVPVAQALQYKPLPVVPLPVKLSAPQPVVEKRVALVIGNANYNRHALKNPINDTNDVSDTLKASGFDVIDLRDASLAQMRMAVRLFGDRLASHDVGLVYYSGHGVESKGRNYLIPVQADIQREDEIADQGLDANLILEKMATAGKGVNILIVDACRDDPFGRSFRSSSRGLAVMDAPRGTIIAYSTSPGKVAQDGDGRNSPYTKSLVKAMQKPNVPIEQVFKEVRRSVQAETKNQQTPWENTSLSGDFYFRIER